MMTSVERFLSRVDIPSSDGCWLWTGGDRSYNGYGRFRVNSKRIRVHRFSYTTFVGPIPEGKVLDHLCRNPLCVNPSHLEPVSPGENSLRGDTFAAMNVRKNECPHGHPYNETNTRIRRQGWRLCKTCQVNYDHRRRDAKREYDRQRRARGGLP